MKRKCFIETAPVLNKFKPLIFKSVYNDIIMMGDYTVDNENFTGLHIYVLETKKATVGDYFLYKGNVAYYDHIYEGKAYIKINDLETIHNIEDIYQHKIIATTDPRVDVYKINPKWIKQYVEYLPKYADVYFHDQLNMILSDIEGYAKICSVKQNFTIEEVENLLMKLGAECFCDDGELKGKSPVELAIWINQKI